MEFSIDVKTKLNGVITITDYSKEYDQYLNEDAEIVFDDSDFKYSETATINSILKVNPNKVEFLDVLLDDHSKDVDSSTFKIKRDGYYIVEHFVIPNIKWLERIEDTSHWETIYVTDSEKIYKLIENNLEEVSIKEILERNIEGTTLQKCKIDIIYTGHLLECYINYCKRIYDTYLNKCMPTTYNSDIYARDFIWMSLNIIDYLVGFKQYLEAEKLITEIHGCGGFCNDSLLSNKNSCGCGCSKA